jgi:hypothetical protein
VGGPAGAELCASRAARPAGGAEAESACGLTLRFGWLGYRVVVVVAELRRTRHVIEWLCSVRLGLLLPR